jgi:hypothetical protein
MNVDLDSAVDIKIWLRSMLRLKMIVATSKREVLVGYLGLMAALNVGVLGGGQPALSALLLAGTATSFATTAFILRKFDYLNLRLYPNMFSNPRIGLRAISIAHDTLVNLTRCDPEDILGKSTFLMNEVVSTDPTPTPGRWNVGVGTIERMRATGVEPGVLLSGTARDIAALFVREAMYQYVYVFRERGRKLSSEAQCYIVENDPEWLTAQPDLFDATWTDITHPGLLSTVISLQVMGLNDTEQLLAVREWLDERSGKSVQQASTLPEMTS